MCFIVRVLSGQTYRGVREVRWGKGKAAKRYFQERSQSDPINCITEFEPLKGKVAGL